jgi:hypothetical protein
MIDRKTFEIELEEARRTRIETQAAGSDIEELVNDMQSGRQQRPMLVAYGFDLEALTQVS